MVRALVEGDLAAVVHELALPAGEAAAAALVHQRQAHGARQHVLATCKRDTWCSEVLVVSETGFKARLIE